MGCGTGFDDGAEIPIDFDIKTVGSDKFGKTLGNIEAIERKHKQFLIGTRPWAQWSAEEQKKQQALLRNSHSQHLRNGKNEVKIAVMDICCLKRNDANDRYLGYAQVRDYFTCARAVL